MKSPYEYFPHYELLTVDPPSWIGRLFGFEITFRRVPDPELEMLKERAAAAVGREQQVRGELNNVRSELHSKTEANAKTVDALETVILNQKVRLESQKYWVVRQKPMTDDELTAACKVDDKNPLWQAIHQMTENLERNCRQLEAEHASDPALMNGYRGAAEQLAGLRQDLFVRRGHSLEAMRRGVPNRKNRFEKEGDEENEI